MQKQAKSMPREVREHSLRIRAQSVRQVSETEWDVSFGPICVVDIEAITQAIDESDLSPLCKIMLRDSMFRIAAVNTLENALVP